MNIKNAEAHALAKELAELEQTTVTEAVVISLREALARRRAREAGERRARARATLERLRAELDASPGPSLWDINDDLYDEMGLPK